MIRNIICTDKTLPSDFEYDNIRGGGNLAPNVFSTSNKYCYKISPAHNYSNIIPIIGYQDFTVRFKTKIEKFSNENHIICLDSDINLSSYMRISVNLNDSKANKKISAELWTRNTYPRILTTTYALNVNVIYEIALSRKNNTFYLFLNGSLIGSFNLSLYLTNVISSESLNTSNHALTAYISDISINIGKALYTSNYTVTNNQFLENTYGKVFNVNSLVYSI